MDKGAAVWVRGYALCVTPQGGLALHCQQQKILSRALPCPHAPAASPRVFCVSLSQREAQPSDDDKWKEWVKSKFKAFNAALESIYGQQTGWIIPDPTLKAGVKQEVIQVRRAAGAGGTSGGKGAEDTDRDRVGGQGGQRGQGRMGGGPRGAGGSDGTGTEAGGQRGQGRMGGGAQGGRGSRWDRDRGRGAERKGQGRGNDREARDRGRGRDKDRGWGRGRTGGSLKAEPGARLRPGHHQGTASGSRKKEERKGYALGQAGAERGTSIAAAMTGGSEYALN